MQVEIVLIQKDRYLLRCCGLGTKLSIHGTSYIFMGRLLCARDLVYVVVLLPSFLYSLSSSLYLLEGQIILF